MVEVIISFCFCTCYDFLFDIHMFWLSRAVVGSADIKSILKQPIPPPNAADPDRCICFEGYWVPRGNHEPNVDAKVK
jgi:hypothetical protein